METLEKKRKEVAPKVGKVQFNHILLTADYHGKESKIIQSANESPNSKALYEVQKIVAKGPNVSEMEVGDEVYIDIDRLMAPGDSSGKITHIRQLFFNKYTGELVTSKNWMDNPEEDREGYMLLTDREILMVLPK